MTKYDFDKVVNRDNTNSTKWNFRKELFGVEDVLPMWVADMDFTVPPAIVEAIKKRADHGIFGYSQPDDRYYQATINWMKKRHNWDIKKEWFVITPGVVPAISMLVRTFTHPGDKVILQSPVYYPFYSAITLNGCQVVLNPLKFEDGHYTMDFNDLETKFDSRVKLLILCSPHNPVGRVWSKEELTKLGEICLKHNVIIISDEIHEDLVYKEYTHIPFASLSEEFAMHSITCTAPSKTFNLAGLQTSNIIIPNPKLRNDFQNMLESNAITSPNIFGIVALQTAYEEGEEWLDQLLDYLHENLNFLIEYIEKNMPQIKVIKPEGTYLVWLDFRSLGMDALSLKNFLLEKAKVAFDDGYIFGPGGEGFERINIACPRSLLKEGLDRIARAVNSL